MRIVTVRPAARCVACHDALDALALQAVCPACDARGHVDCLTGLRGCPTLGCARRPPVVPSVVFAAWPTQPAPSRCWTRPRVGRIAAALLVFGALAGAFMTPGVIGQGHAARVQRVAADMKALDDAVHLYRVDCGAYPPSLEALWTRPPDSHGWGPIPYLKEYPPTDPWGTEYVYRYEGGGRILLISYGADGVPGGDDESLDLSSRALNER